MSEVWGRRLTGHMERNDEISKDIFGENCRRMEVEIWPEECLQQAVRHHVTDLKLEVLEYQGFGVLVIRIGAYMPS
jgi:hypothetical protein